MIYEVTIVEKLSRKIRVVADSEKEAKKEAAKKWSSCEVILDSDDFASVDFI